MKKFVFSFLPAQAVAQYDNEGAFNQLLSMMKRGERIDLRLFTSKDNHPSVWAESRTVEGFRYDVSPESFESILEYLRTGIYETFEKCKRESEALDAGEDFQMMVLKQFVEAGMSLKYVPLFREYTDKITGSYFYLKGKVVFRVNRTQELINYLRENSQTI